MHSTHYSDPYWLQIAWEIQRWSAWNQNIRILWSEGIYRITKALTYEAEIQDISQDFRPLLWFGVLAVVFAGVDLGLGQWINVYTFLMFRNTTTEWHYTSISFCSVYPYLEFNHQPALLNLLHLCHWGAWRYWGQEVLILLRSTKNSKSPDSLDSLLYSSFALAHGTSR